LGTRIARLIFACSLAALAGRAGTLPGLPLGPNDLISLSVFGSTHLTNTFRIGPNGDLRLPLLQGALDAKGMLPDQLADTIAAELKKQKIMVKPIVLVNVLEYGERPVTVIGAVSHPLTFQVTGSVTLLDALARAGGLSPEAGPEILLTRAKNDVARIAAAPLLRDPVSQYNLRLYGGEEIRVPYLGHVYVIGNVRWPGEFGLRYTEATTALKVLARAGGEAAFARDPAILYRLDPASQRIQETELPLKRIARHRTDDVVLLPEDIVYVPEARGRRLAHEVIARILGAGTLVGAGVGR
jgi:polysaccharide export outer membrane protein